MVRTLHFYCRRAQVPSPVGELGSHMPWGATERKDEEKWQVFSQRLGKTVTKEMIKIARVIRHILLD